MTFFKIVQNNETVDAGFVFLNWNKKHNRLLICNVNQGQYVQSSRDLSVYRCSWLKPAPAEAPEAKTAEIIVITQEEYESIIESLASEE